MSENQKKKTEKKEQDVLLKISSDQERIYYCRCISNTLIRHLGIQEIFLETPLFQSTFQYDIFVNLIYFMCKRHVNQNQS